MATGSDKYQDLSDRINAAAAHETPFILPWRMEVSRNLPFGPNKEHDSCSSGECGCGISRDDDK